MKKISKPKKPPGQPKSRGASKAPVSGPRPIPQPAGTVMYSIEHVHSQCQILYEELSSLSIAEQKQRPSAHFGERYNELLSQAMQTLGDGNPSHWPPRISVDPPSKVGGPKVAYATYVELRVYARQIADRLGQEIEPLPILMG